MDYYFKFVHVRWLFSSAIISKAFSFRLRYLAYNDCHTKWERVCLSEYLCIEPNRIGFHFPAHFSYESNVEIRNMILNWLGVTGIGWYLGNVVLDFITFPWIITENSDRNYSRKWSVVQRKMNDIFQSSKHWAIFGKKILKQVNLLCLRKLECKPPRLYFKIFLISIDVTTLFHDFGKIHSQIYFSRSPKKKSRLPNDM